MIQERLTVAELVELVGRWRVGRASVDERQTLVRAYKLLRDLPSNGLAKDEQAFVDAAEADLHGLVRVALSRVLGERKGSHPGGYQMQRMLGLYGASATTFHGHTLPAPCPGLPSKCTDDMTAMRQLRRGTELVPSELAGDYRRLLEARDRLQYDGDAPNDAAVAHAAEMTPVALHELERRVTAALQSRYLLHEYWQSLKSAQYELAELPEAIIEAFVPREYWVAVEAYICDGDVVAARRTSTALRKLAAQPLAHTNKRRAGGTPSKETLTNWGGRLTFLNRQLKALHDEGHPSLFLGNWTRVVKPAVPETDSAGIKTEAPTLSGVRTALAALNLEIRRKLSLDPERDGFREELEAMKALPKSRLKSLGLARLTRDRAVFALELASGGRVGAVEDRLRGHFRTDFDGLPPDGRGPYALLMNPGKTISIHDQRPKALTEEQGLIVEVYLCHRDRLRREVYGFDHVGADTEPLIVGKVSRERLLPLSKTDLNLMFSGPSGSRRRELAVKGSHPRPTIIPRPKATIAAGVPEVEHPYIGHTIHELRHFAYQLAVAAGNLWNEEHPPHLGAELPEHTVDGEVYAAALLDHKHQGVGAVYGDRNTEKAYEVLSGRVIANGWRIVTGRVGQRRRPRVDEIREKASWLRAFESDMTSTAEKLRTISARAVVNDAPAFPAVDPAPATPDLRAKLDAALKGLATLSDQNQVLFEQNHELRQLIGATSGLGLDIQQAATRHAELLVEVNRLLHDRDTWDYIPDDAPPGSEDLPPNFLEEVFQPQLLVAATGVHQRVRDWLLVIEFQALLGLSHSTVARWALGQQMPKRRPWDEGAVAIDSSLGPRLRRIWIPGIRDEFWPTDLIRDAVDEALADWPRRRGFWQEGQPTWRCFAPLDLPASLSSRYAAEGIIYPDGVEGWLRAQDDAPAVAGALTA